MAAERARAEQHHVPNHGDPAPCVGMTRPGMGSEGAVQEVQEVQAALGRQADPGWPAAVSPHRDWPAARRRR
jgi:hypothetical protein